MAPEEFLAATRGMWDLEDPPARTESGSTGENQAGPASLVVSFPTDGRRSAGGRIVDAPPLSDDVLSFHSEHSLLVRSLGESLD